MSVCMDRGLSQRLDRLVSLSIISRKRYSQLPGLGKLQSLKYLKLMYLDDINYIKPSFYGIDTASSQVPRKIFPALRQLHLYGMKNLKNLKHFKICDTNLNPIFHDIGEIQICSWFPLESLVMNRCRNVRELPEYFCKFQSMRSLEMTSCENLKLFPIPMGQQQGLTSLHRFALNGCDELTRLPHELLSFCASLTHVEIKHCDALSKLPTNLLDSCGSLHYLEISELKNLEYFPLDLEKTPLSFLNFSPLPKLMTLPRLKPLSSYTTRRLFELKIGGFSDSIPEVDWSELSWFSPSLHRLELMSWPYMMSLPIQLQHLTALTELILSKLVRMKALPDWFGKLVSLEILHIDNCQKLFYLPFAAAMRSLTKLST